MTINEATGVSEKIRTCVQCGTEFKVEKGHKFGRCCSNKCDYARNKHKRLKAKKRWSLRNPGKQAEYMKAWKARNPGRIGSLVREWHNKQSPAWHMFMNAKERARANKLPFTITVNDIVVPEVCPYLNIPLFKSADGVARANSPSLDRIVPKLGYVVNNIRVVSQLANRMKQNATEEELIAFAHGILRLHS